MDGLDVRTHWEVGCGDEDTDLSTRPGLCEWDSPSTGDTRVRDRA